MENTLNLSASVYSFTFRCNRKLSWQSNKSLLFISRAKGFNFVHIFKTNNGLKSSQAALIVLIKSLSILMSKKSWNMFFPASNCTILPHILYIAPILSFNIIRAAKLFCTCFKGKLICRVVQC